MIGKTTIDDLDLFTTYGIYITQGGYEGIVAYPALKPVESNQWPEEDGREVDLSAPVLDTKEFDISFAGFAGNDLEGFMAKLSDGAYHTFRCFEIGHTLSLRLISQPALRIAPNGEPFSFSLKFSDDFPMTNYAYPGPLSSAAVSQGYSLDGIDLAAYGVILLHGSEAEILKSPPVKTPQVTRFKSRPGLLDLSGNFATTYDDFAVVYQHKEVTIQCLLRAPSLSNCWRNYFSLLYDLIRPGLRTFTAPSIGTTPCYYKKSNVSRFFFEGSIWLEFTITLEFTNFRI